MDAIPSSLIDPARDIPAELDDVDIILPSVTPPVAAVPIDLRRLRPASEPLPIRALDPRSILIPNAPNRVQDFTDDPSFEELRISIASGGRNSQPILVRELIGQSKEYQLVSGERRLTASLMEDLLVHAQVLPAETPSTIDCIERIRENSGREDLSPYELSQQLKYAAQTLKSRTQGELAALLGISVSKISRAKDLASLPDEMIAAFESPRHIRIQDIKTLKDAWIANPEAVLKEAATMQQLPQRPDRAAVILRYQKAVQSKSSEAAADGVAPCKTAETAGPAEPKAEPLLCHGEPAGSWTLPAPGVLDIRLEAEMSKPQRNKLLALVQGFLEKRVMSKPPATRTAPADAVATLASASPAALTAPTQEVA